MKLMNMIGGRGMKNEKINGGSGLVLCLEVFDGC